MRSYSFFSVESSDETPPTDEMKDTNPLRTEDEQLPVVCSVEINTDDYLFTESSTDKEKNQTDDELVSDFKSLALLNDPHVIKVDAGNYLYKTLEIVLINIWLHFHPTSLIKTIDAFDTLNIMRLSTNEEKVHAAYLSQLWVLCNLEINNTIPSSSDTVGLLLNCLLRYKDTIVAFNTNKNNAFFSYYESRINKLVDDLFIVYPSLKEDAIYKRICNVTKLSHSLYPYFQFSAPSNTQTYSPDASSDLDHDRIVKRRKR